MSSQPDEPEAGAEETARPSPVEPPSLPALLLDPRPMVAVFTIAWVIAAIAAFTVADLETWRPITVAGSGLAVFGTSLFLWQRHAARRGSKSAQPGLQ